MKILHGAPTSRVHAERISAPFLRSLLSLALLVGGAWWLAAAEPAGLDAGVLLQMQALQEEKAAFTPAQRKMDSQLVFAIKKDRRQPIARGMVSKMRIGAKADTNGLVKVDIKATVTTNLLEQIQKYGGRVINAFPQFEAIRAWVPLRRTEALAARADVKFIRPAVPAIQHNQDQEGVVTHQVDSARARYGVDGSGVKVGVLSGSVEYLGLAQAQGDLGPVIVLPGQEGLGTPGEGTAMLEIVHAMAPGAQLYYAAGEEGEAQLAQNILDLRAAGCDVIVDDIGYPDEPPFQDGLLAQAVNSVTSSGGLYFSSAGNGGNFDSGSSGTWQGDFVNGGLAAPPVNGKGGLIHKFGSLHYDEVQQPGQDAVLFWSDPMGASTNDYDLYVLDSTGTSVVASSITVQDGSQDPLELIWSGTTTGERLVIVQASGAPRYLYLNTYGGFLAAATPGNILGHAAATNAFAVAAADVLSAYPQPFTGGSANPVEYFSSDGPRRVFFNGDGSAITPGNFSSTGGAVRLKPDITAADGVTTSVPGPSSYPPAFGPFYGTSAAAPHAAAIAALLKSYNSTLTPAQIRSALTTSALRMSGLGYVSMAPKMDRDSGFGIVMADRALLAASMLVTNAAQPGGQTTLGGVFSNAPGTSLTTLYSFSYGKDGAVPNGLAFATNGVLYGTTRFGGSPDQNITGASTGYGTLFAITTNGVFTTLSLFENTNGMFPFAGLSPSTGGGFYGTTRFGGPNLWRDPSQFGYGTFFQMSPNGGIISLAAFGGTNGSAPSANLVLGKDGSFYGTTVFGGPASNAASIFGPVGSSDAGLGVGYGTIFKVTTNGTITPLAYFNGTNGANTPASLTVAVDGSFYGITPSGGASGFGTVFKLSTNGALTTLHSFGGGLDGGHPFAGLAPGADGGWYGTTYDGGTGGAGTVFRILTNGNFSTLVSFNGTNGANPQAALLQGLDGSFFGTTAYGGPGNAGSIFRMTPAGLLTTLIWFDGTNGATPESALVQTPEGSIWGTTAGGGDSDNGTIFRLRVPAPGPLFQSVILTNGFLTLTWSGQAGRTYQVQTTPSLSQSSWTTLTNVIATNGIPTAFDSITPASTRFYRVILMP